MGLFVVGRLAARHGVRVRLRHAQSGGLTALIWLPEAVAMPESGQPLGRLRNFEADDYGPAPSLSAPTAASPLPGAPTAVGNGFSGAAATASRIPRLGGGPAANGNGNPPAGGGFAAFGAGVAPGAPNGTGDHPGAQPAAPGSNGAAPGGASGPPATIDGPGGRLPVRTPGSHPLGPVSQGNGGAVLPGDTLGDSAFATTRMPAVGGDGGSAGTGTVIPDGPPAGHGIGGSDGSQVNVPPSVGAGPGHRLPIFDTLESDWFRRSGKPLSSETAPAAGQAWNSPADEGWRAAQVAVSPEAGENTNAGLPKRVPRANLVPGSVGGRGEETEDAPPVRSAELVRNRMSSFQRGVREARAAVPQNEEP
jgi:hypothetical protein